ncbi:peptidoglycan/xylan/chitin deacetylase (PgdA/CDA1 family) [Kitasatospora gansuensis]|uniref:Peptidoglycan/xylan/chitin deacetylase (PgdA/CDA1 family) n=1 Tax=Kitasatospora gansuensis TaxID=258050 RepID=A0A7W7SJ78_9ACTN|nr:polysaccharide deacetylase family protein [Kitasatospora gansuensis]MBB4950888.1 peptidoglycan/xylan/chitin deacetylase (PgdA/CDA1 family) [Kitasatospora gansuensis]
MWFAGVGLTRDGYRIAVVDGEGRPVGAAERYERCAQQRPVARLAELAGRAPDGLTVVVDSAGGLLDGLLATAGLDVRRADPHLLVDGRNTAEELAGVGQARFGALVPLPPGSWIMTGREQEVSAAEAAAGPVERRLAAEGRCLLGGGEDSEPTVALTFDDGPHPENTQRVLELLRRHDVRATFFCIGLNALAHPALVRRIVEEGHLLGNHTWSHAYLPDLGREGLRQQLDFTAEVLAEASGVGQPVLMRPPYGGRSPQLMERVADLGLTTVLWDVDTEDWAEPGAEVIAERVLRQVRPGSVVLMHDGGGDRSQTVAALPRIIDGLRRRGYRFVTPAELLTGRPRTATR